MKTIFKYILPPIFIALGAMLFNLTFLIVTIFGIKEHPLLFAIQLVATFAFPIAIFLVTLNVQYLKIVRMLYDESVKLIKNLVVEYYKNRDKNANVIESFEPWLVNVKNSTARRLITHFLMKIPFEQFYKACELMSPSKNDVDYIISLAFLKIDNYVKEMLSTTNLTIISTLLIIFNLITTISVWIY